MVTFRRVSQTGPCRPRDVERVVRSINTERPVYEVFDGDQFVGWVGHRTYLTTGFFRDEARANRGGKWAGVGPNGVSSYAHTRRDVVTKLLSRRNP